MRESFYSFCDTIIEMKNEREGTSPEALEQKIRELEEKLVRSGRVLRRWNRTFMGCRASPYLACRANLIRKKRLGGIPATGKAL